MHGSHWIADTNENLKVDKDMIVSIPARGLNISWGNDCRFWKFVDAPKDGSSGSMLRVWEKVGSFRSINLQFWKRLFSRLKPVTSSLNIPDGDAAELVQVNDLEVKGRIDLEHKERFFSPEKTYEIFYIIKFKSDAFGWDACPISLELTAPNGQKIKRSEHFERYTKKSSEDWHHVSGGEFNIRSELKGRVEFGMYEIQTSYWKGGMILYGVQIKPKN
ncbi:hypothetical protein J5N97_009056 [Dioscorea zingiberensis]|uniref:Uncharacterized protein n=1 Tax=Dioscorea zingiberensis TaxID=325984 RepID=A0A9D5CWE0_9LILI|nr:hypothetical protein J5N97_009056 [Dioscorea zingiberensis]